MGVGSEKRTVLLSKHVNYDNVLGTAVDAVTAAANLTNAASTITTQPDVPRNIILTIVDTTPSITAGTITVDGIDVNGKRATEVHDCSAGAGLYTGAIPFAKLTSVTSSGFTALDGTGDETLAIGVGDVLGLPVGPNGKLLDVYMACAAGVQEAVGTVNKTYSTIDPTSATTGGGVDFDFWYLYEVSLL